MKVSICRNYKRSREKEFNNKIVADGWETREIAWNEKDVIDLTTGFGISGNEFRSGHRSNDQWQATNFIMLDFDDGRMTKELLLEKQKAWKFDSYIFSSQNHQKVKGSLPPCDRLRALIPLSSPITNEQTRQHVEQSFRKTYPGLDPGFMDRSRYFAHGTTDVSSFANSRGHLDWRELVGEADFDTTETTAPETPPETRDFLINGVSQGQRDNACFKAACTLRDCGYSREDALVLLHKGADQCDPPFPHSEVLLRLNSAYNKYPVQPFAFIEPTTSAYYYLYTGKLYQATKDILRETFKSRGGELPSQYPVLEFKFDVNDDHQIDLKKGTYNLFKPTIYQLMKKSDLKINPVESFPNIYRLLSNLIPKNAEKQYFLNWVAAILQTRQKMMMSFVFIGPQGAGKGVLLSHILKPLFGELQTIQVEDEQLKSSFNGWIKHAFFIAFNEVAHDNRGRNSLNSKIKSIVTDPTIIVNEKNIRTYQIQNNVNCVFFSNERVPMLVERSDRRFSIIETGGNLARQDWFKVPQTFRDFKNELKAFAQFLWNKDVDLDKANTPLNNDIKDILITAGQNRWEEFAFHLKNADEEWFKDQLPLHNLWAPDWSDMKEKHRIEKTKALDIFKAIYEMQDVSQTAFTKQMALYGIRGIRPGTGFERKHFYEWA